VADQRLHGIMDEEYTAQDWAGLGMCVESSGRVAPTREVLFAVWTTEDNGRL